MHCEDALELISDYLGGQLDRALTVSLENHLATCANCREEVASLRRVWATLDQMPAVEPPPFFHENLMSRLAAETEKAEAARRRVLWDWRALFRPRALAFAASALVLLLTGMEVVHTQRAALDPLGWILNTLHPIATDHSALQTAEAYWAPDPQGGGKLIVLLQSDSRAEASPSQWRYRLAVSGTSPAEARGIVATDKLSRIEVALPVAPAPDALTITLTPQGGDQAIKTLHIPIRNMPTPLR